MKKMKKMLNTIFRVTFGKPSESTDLEKMIFTLIGMTFCTIVIMIDRGII